VWHPYCDQITALLLGHCLQCWHAVASAFRQPSPTCRTAFLAQHLRLSGGHSQSLAQWPQTHSRILSGIQRAVQIVLGIYFKRTCSRVTSASSALGVLNDYALYKSTHSLTHMAMKYHLTFIYVLNMGVLPSVLSRCWLGGRKGIRPVKNWVVGCWHGYLSGAKCRLAYGPADATATHCLLLQ